MANATLAFQWLNLLEKDLDNIFVDVDLLLNDIDEGDDDLLSNIRSKMSALCSIFAQMSHKSQTIFENSAKLEAQYISLRRDLEGAVTEVSLQQVENAVLIKQIHALQLKLHSLDESDPDSEAILARLNKESDARMAQERPFAQMEATVSFLESVNGDLKQYLLALQAELYGARLAAKYLDKELAGRIQQIQLLGHNIKGSNYQKLWSTLESEINLHRQKTVIQACKGHGNIIQATNEPPSDSFNTIRNVRILKGATENLGMSVTGGKEHGVPLLVSEIYPNQVVARQGRLFVGDAILSVNGTNLRSMRHVDAVKILCQPMEEMNLEVMYISNTDSRDTDDNNKVYVTEGGYKYRLYQHHSLPTRNNHTPGPSYKSQEAKT